MKEEVVSMIWSGMLHIPQGVFHEVDRKAAEQRIVVAAAKLELLADGIKTAVERLRDKELSLKERTEFALTDVVKLLGKATHTLAAMERNVKYIVAEDMLNRLRKLGGE
jgi:hypothetical protein